MAEVWSPCTTKMVELVEEFDSLKEEFEELGSDTIFEAILVLLGSVRRGVGHAGSIEAFRKSDDSSMVSELTYSGAMNQFRVMLYILRIGKSLLEEKNKTDP